MFKVLPSCVTGLVVLVLIFLTTVYKSTDKQESESIYAEQLVGVHKKLQQVNEDNFDPVKFIPSVQGNAEK